MLRAIGICLIVLRIALNLLNEVKGQEFASVDKNNLSFLEYTYPKDKYPDCTEPSNVELLNRFFFGSITRLEKFVKCIRIINGAR